MTRTAKQVASETDSSLVHYEINLYITRPVRYDHDLSLVEQEAWRLSAEAKRELEREVLRAVQKIDGDCDCEVMSARVSEA